MTNSFVKPCSFCDNAIEMIEQENGRWKAVDEYGNPHHCLRIKREGIK